MRFAIVTRDELWEDGHLREERVSWGEATADGDEIIATDSGEPATSPARTGEVARAPQVRRVSSVRRIGDHVRAETVIVLAAGPLSVVSSPEHAAADSALLLKFASRRVDRGIDYRGLPIIWNNGSGSVLLHEAAGHPAEHEQAPLDWPEWLSVTDEPSFEIDDAGRPTHIADLLRGEKPSAMRRASFTDRPFPRLSRIIVRQKGAPFDLPDPRIDVHLVAGGRYDALTENVLVFVAAADFVEGGRTGAIAPFTVAESRSSISRAVRGASGGPQRYPGVICSLEGQEIAVGSEAPVLLTLF